MLGVFFVADGKTDASYLKFTTPKQNSLIIGASRAAQGLQPVILNEKLNRNDIYNYAFTLMSSPYGESYFNSIQKKLKNNPSNGLYILEVNPWTLSKTIDLNTKKEYKPELAMQSFVTNTQYVSMNPNIEYLVESYNERFLRILENKFNDDKIKKIQVYSDGWLKVELNDSILDKESRIERKLNNYSSYLEYYIPKSKRRLSYLEKTIEMLSLKGNVVLVRLPIDKRMMDIENKLQSTFNQDIQQIADRLGVTYYNLTSFNDVFQYNDGNHLTIESGIKVSELLAKLIADNK